MILLGRISISLALVSMLGGPALILQVVRSGQVLVDRQMRYWLAEVVIFCSSCS